MPERPRPTPYPQVPSELEEEPQTNPHIRRSNYITKLVSFGVAGGFSLATLGGVAYAYEKLRDAATDAGTKAAEKTIGDVTETARYVKVVDVDLQQHKAAEAQALLEIKQDVHDSRNEQRELYRAVMEHRRSNALEQPLPPIKKDGGR